MDLYRLLGVRKNATQDQIKKAYRKKSRVYHPDCGGDAKKFSELQMAYEILMDKERRKHYDETGEVADKKPDNTLSRIAEVISTALSATIVQLSANNRDLRYTDVVEHMGILIQTQKKEQEDRIKSLNKSKELLGTVKDRFETNGEENLLQGIATAHQRQIGEALSRTEKLVENMELALQYLKKFKYRLDKQAASAHQWFTTLGGPSSSTFLNSTSFLDMMAEFKSRTQ